MAQIGDPQKLFEHELGMALGAWSIHEGRRRDAEHRAVMEDLVREAAELAEDVRSGRRQLPAR